MTTTTAALADEPPARIYRRRRHHPLHLARAHHWIIETQDNRSIMEYHVTAI